MSIPSWRCIMRNVGTVSALPGISGVPCLDLTGLAPLLALCFSRKALSMITFPARRRWLTALALGLVLHCGCARSQPVASRQVGAVVAIDPATMVTAEETVSKTFQTGATP